MSDNVKETARDIIDKLSPIADEAEDEIDAENREFMMKAVPLMFAAVNKWKEEHGPNEHCDIEVAKGENGELMVKVTPKEVI